MSDKILEFIVCPHCGLKKRKHILTREQWSDVCKRHSLDPQKRALENKPFEFTSTDNVGSDLYFLGKETDDER